MTSEVPSNCKEHVLDFVIKEGDPEVAAVEDDIKQDLAAIGITVNTVIVNATEYVRLEKSGEYNLFFTRSWGAPYDPHTYMNSWSTPAYVEYSATRKLEAPLTRDRLMERIIAVQEELDEVKIQNQWKEILTDVHNQAIFLPLWGTRVPYVLNRRFAGFTPSSQTYSYPLDTVRVLSGPKEVTVSPGTGNALFQSAGPLHPHQYYPNQLFTQAWVYEGLVAYGQDGLPQPALAKSWVKEGIRVTFTLRENVKFHDDTDFNCEAVKLNFDHVLSESAKKRHSWMGAVRAIKSWECNDDGKFIIDTNTPFYPLLQELSYIRPLTIAAPSSFVGGDDAHPELANSCNPGAAKWKDIEAIEGFECAGLNDTVGTGPFKYVSRKTDADGNDEEVSFAHNHQYWGVVPDIESIALKAYDSTEAVEEALLNGSLDMALGIGPLAPKQVQYLKFYHSDKVDVRHSDVLQHSLMVMNTDKSPTNDINVRKAIIHAVNKDKFLIEEFSGLEKPVGQILPQSAPYCNLDLNPKWSYDPLKAKLLNCPPEMETMESSKALEGGAITGIVIGSVVGVFLIGFIVRMIQREKSGKPMFSPPTKGEAV